jgi:hypothetical protein
MLMFSVSVCECIYSFFFEVQVSGMFFLSVQAERLAMVPQTSQREE